MGPICQRLRWEVDRFEMYTGLRVDGIKMAAGIFSAWKAEVFPQAGELTWPSFDGIGVLADPTLPVGAVLVISPQASTEVYPAAPRVAYDFKSVPGIHQIKPFEGYGIPKMLDDAMRAAHCKEPKTHAAGCECGRL